MELGVALGRFPKIWESKSIGSRSRLGIEVHWKSKSIGNRFFSVNDLSFFTITQLNMEVGIY